MLFALELDDEESAMHPSSGPRRSDAWRMCQFIGGPVDGARNAALPRAVARVPVQDVVIKVSFEPPNSHVFAHYRCRTLDRLAGAWPFGFEGLFDESGVLASEPPTSAT